MRPNEIWGFLSSIWVVFSTGFFFFFSPKKTLSPLKDSIGPEGCYHKARTELNYFFYHMEALNNHVIFKIYQDLIRVERFLRQQQKGGFDVDK